MREQSKIAFYILFFIFATFVKGFGQNTNWLQRSWNGRAFILSNGPKENYNLILTIGKIKGKTFEGNLKTINPSDTAIQFNTRVDGFIYDKHMTINIGTWKVNCGNCKPQSLSFSIENGKFYLKGEAKGCSQECTWITVFSRDLAEFDLKTQDDLFASAEEIIVEPGAETPLVVDNNEPPKPEPKTEPEVKKIPEPEVAKRIAILPAGAIVVTQKNLTANSQIKPPSRANPGLQLKEGTSGIRVPLATAGPLVAIDNGQNTKPGATPGFNQNSSLKINDASPEKRIPVLATAPVVITEKTDATALNNPKGTINKNAGLTVDQTAPEKKITILPAGDVVVDNNKNSITANKTPSQLNKSAGVTLDNSAPEKRIAAPEAAALVIADKSNGTNPAGPKGTLDKNPGLSIDASVPEKKIPVLEAGSVVVTEKNTGVLTPNQNKNSLQNQPGLNVDKKTNVKVPVVKDSVATLPEGFSERKKTVIRTIDVDADSITLRLYDNGVVDGDIVSVIYNDKVVVDKLSLVSRALVIKLAIKKDGVNTLVFHAHNLGEFPPNTAQLEVLYGTKKEELTVSSDLTVSSTIDIIYQKK